MREIKFRGKRVDNGEWVYGDLIHNAFDGYRIFPVGIKTDGNYPVEVVPETVGQFTGLHDKNGKEIYEGDKCKIKFDISKVEDYIYNSLTEKEIKSGEREFIVESPLFNNQPELNCDDIEVIGNIHENPEIING